MRAKRIAPHRNNLFVRRRKCKNFRIAIHANVRGLWAETRVPVRRQFCQLKQGFQSVRRHFLILCNSQAGLLLPGPKAVRGEAAPLGRKEAVPSRTEGIPSWAEGNPSQSEGNPNRAEGIPSRAEGNPNVYPPLNRGLSTG